MSDPTRPAPKPRKHLMDPNAPRPVRDHTRENESLRTVQRRVLSALAVTTILHLAAGLIIAAMFLAQEDRAAEIGLSVIAGAFGSIAVASGLAIHGKRVLSPWLLLGVIVAAIGIWLTGR